MGVATGTEHLPGLFPEHDIVQLADFDRAAGTAYGKTYSDGPAAYFYWVKWSR